MGLIVGNKYHCKTPTGQVTLIYSGLIDRNGILWHEFSSPDLPDEIFPVANDDAWVESLLLDGVLIPVTDAYILKKHQAELADIWSKIKGKTDARSAY